MKSPPQESPSFRYMLELFDQKSGESLGRGGIDQPDFEPAIRGATFQAWCRDVNSGADSGRHDFPAPSIEPRWHSEKPRPLIEGVTVKIGTDVSLEAPIDIFKRDASALATRLVSEKKIEAGTTYIYRASAFPGPAVDVGPAANNSLLTVETTEESFPDIAADTTTGPSTCQPALHDADYAHADDSSVILPERVFTQASAMAANANGHEIGGFLVGQVVRVDGKLALVISDQIPAWHTDRAEMSLKFTPATWQALGESLELRGRNEVVAGWQHVHCAKSWCSKCEKQCTTDEELRTRLDACPYQSPFFSEADRQMSRAAFSAPYQVGLLVVDTTLNGMQFGMFGWRNGVLVRRAYEIVDDTNSLISSEPASTPTQAAVAAAP